MSNTNACLLYTSQYGFSSPEQLEAAVATAYQEMRQTSGELKALETKLQGKMCIRDRYNRDLAEWEYQVSRKPTAAAKEQHRPPEKQPFIIEVSVVALLTKITTNRFSTSTVFFSIIISFPCAAHQRWRVRHTGRTQPGAGGHPHGHPAL